MKRFLCCIGLLAGLLVLTAVAPNQTVSSITINGCGTLTGDVKLEVRVIPGPPFIQATNNCQLHRDGTLEINFFMPAPALPSK